MTSNFSFFRGKWDVLANLGETAESNVYHDPHTTLMKLRLFGETLTKFILASENIREATVRHKWTALILFVEKDY